MGISSSENLALTVVGLRSECSGLNLRAKRPWVSWLWIGSDDEDCIENVLCPYQ